MAPAEEQHQAGCTGRLQQHAARLPTTMLAGVSSQARREKEEDTGMAETALDEDTMELGGDRGGLQQQGTGQR